LERLAGFLYGLPCCMPCRLTGTTPPPAAWILRMYWVPAHPRFACLADLPWCRLLPPHAFAPACLACRQRRRAWVPLGLSPSWVPPGYAACRAWTTPCRFLIWFSAAPERRLDAQHGLGVWTGTTCLLPGFIYTYGLCLPLRSCLNICIYIWTTGHFLITYRLWRALYGQRGLYIGS